MQYTNETIPQGKDLKKKSPCPAWLLPLKLTKHARHITMVIKYYAVVRRGKYGHREFPRDHGTWFPANHADTFTVRPSGLVITFESYSCGRISRFITYVCCISSPPNGIDCPWVLSDQRK